MFVLSQDKKKFADYKGFEVAKNYGGKKDGKYSLVGTDYRGVSGQTVILGFYSNEEDAIKELEKIYDAVKNGEHAYAVE